MLPLERAVEVFARAFCFGRSFMHPCEVVQVGPLWVMRDAPRRSGKYRAEEIVVHGVPPEQAVTAIREYGPGRFFVCAVDPNGADFESVRQGYKSLGFRAMRVSF